MNKRKLLRILDANLNRAREGLRVCEDISRFLMEEKSLTSSLKNLRHEIIEVMETTPYKKEKIIEYRNIHTDKTKYLDPEQEFTRKDIRDIFESNIQRVQESLRVMEEITKLEDLNLSKGFKKLRFKTYMIEKDFFTLF